VLLVLPIGFAFGFFGSMPLAGPIALLVFTRGLRRDYRAGLAIAGGAAIAESGYALFAYWGFGELLTRFPVLGVISKAAATLILFALGVWFVLVRPPDPAAAAPPTATRSGFALGFGITALNPTFLATWTAAVAVLHSFVEIPVSLAAALGFSLSAGVGIFAWFWALLAVMRRWEGRFQPRLVRVAIAGVGALLLAMGVWNAVGLARWWLAA